MMQNGKTNSGENGGAINLHRGPEVLVGEGEATQVDSCSRAAPGGAVQGGMAAPPGMQWHPCHGAPCVMYDSW